MLCGRDCRRIGCEADRDAASRCGHYVDGVVPDTGAGDDAQPRGEIHRRAVPAAAAGNHHVGAAQIGVVRSGDDGSPFNELGNGLRHHPVEEEHRRSGVVRHRQQCTDIGAAISASAGDQHQAVTVRVGEHPASVPRPVGVEGGIVGRNLVVSRGEETAGKVDDIVIVREIQDEDVLDRWSGRYRLAWGHELQLGPFVGQPEDDAVETVVILEGPQNPEPDDPLVELA